MRIYITKLSLLESESEPRRRLKCKGKERKEGGKERRKEEDVLSLKVLIVFVLVPIWT